ncbi:hypothetical protein D9M70_603870 [compost metagenome]
MIVALTLSLPIMEGCLTLYWGKGFVYVFIYCLMLLWIKTFMRVIYSARVLVCALIVVLLNPRIMGSAST